MINEPTIIRILEEISNLPDVSLSGYDQGEGAYYAEISNGTFISEYAFGGDDEVQANKVLALAKEEIEQIEKANKTLTAGQ